MTSTSATTNSVFQAFIEAQHALEQLPAVEADLALTRIELNNTHHALADAELTAMQLEDDLKALRATLAAKEEALAGATFRETEMAGKLAVIQSVIGVRQPEPVVVHSEPVNVDRGEAASTNYSEPVASTNEQSGEGTHMGEGYGTGASAMTTASSTASYHGARPRNDAHTPIEDYSHMGEAGSAERTGATYSGASSSNAGSHSDVSTAVEGQSEAAPTRTPSQSDASYSQTSSSGTANGTSIASTPGNASQTGAEPLPYWQKLDTTSWKDWVAAGNEPAPWLSKDFFDPHTVAAK